MRLGTYYRHRLLGFLGLWDDFQPGHDVLDVGGFDGYVLSRLNCRSRTLIDPDAQPDFDGIRYEKADFLSYDFGELKFDRILSLDVIEHLPAGTEHDYLCRMAKLLKPGATAYVTTPSSDIRIFPGFLRRWVAKKWAHYKCLGYSESELRAFLKDTGLQAELIELDAPSYLFWYLPLRALQPLLPTRLLNLLLTQLAAYDVRHNHGTHGYLLLKLRRQAPADR